MSSRISAMILLTVRARSVGGLACVVRLSPGVLGVSSSGGTPAGRGSLGLAWPVSLFRACAACAAAAQRCGDWGCILAPSSRRSPGGTRGRGRDGGGGVGGPSARRGGCAVVWGSSSLALSGDESAGGGDWSEGRGGGISDCPCCVCVGGAAALAVTALVDAVPLAELLAPLSDGWAAPGAAKLAAMAEARQSCWVTPGRGALVPVGSGGKGSRG